MERNCGCLSVFFPISCCHLVSAPSLSSLFPFYKFAMFAYFFYLCRDICKIRIPVARTIIFYNNKQNYYYYEEIISLRLVLDGCNGSAGTWYVGIINGLDTEQSISVDWSFLGGGDYRATIFGDVEDEARAWSIHTVSQLPASVNLAPRGGFVAVLTME